MDTSLEMLYEQLLNEQDALYDRMVREVASTSDERR
jgi:hypothetical protein